MAGGNNDVRLPIPRTPVPHGAANHAEIGVGIHHRDLLAELVWRPYVVGVDERDEFTMAGGDTQVARGTHATVQMALMLEVPHARGITVGVAPCDGAAGLLRAIIDENELEVPELLREDALDRFGSGSDRHSGRW